MTEYNNLKIMQDFRENEIPPLSVAVLGALELFSKEGVQRLKLPKLKKPLIVGSGNAISTARVIFRNSNAFFANENNYKEFFKQKPDGVIIFSASGSKHAPIIAKEAKKAKLKTFLITCTHNSEAEKIVSKKNTVVTPKNREPYTYNTSTYLGWLLATGDEDPKKILEFINTSVATRVPRNFERFTGFVLVTPTSVASVNPLLDVKFKELFGRRIARDITTSEEIKHAVTVVPYDREICVVFGDETINSDSPMVKVPLPKNAGPAAMMAIGYYIIGRIQEQHPPYFKNSIKDYVKRMNRTEFGKNIDVIVE